MTIKNTEQLIDYVNRGNKVKYLFFWGHRKPKKGISKSCLSQWYESPFESDGNRFHTAEHFMMYEKAKLFGDNSAAENSLAVADPGAAKAIGRQVEGFDQELWDKKKFDIVVQANLAKFKGNQALKEFLLNTGDRVLVEASPVDKVWGVGLAEDDDKCQNPKKWKGLNLLGFALIAVRSKLRESDA
ncbi:NADAR family protein [Microbulbifer sp. 2205BS26-8]|uniref:NADAR family protein n=1 Tax=Microbulbifer sp. 2205BS26-8 TaxID=3064386 RepID=UPI00273F19F2|nr:NADAR family protein [Microbulbifer sp. 2205BS26-8]MDP5209926.1 NADAR family protein [Microbulbifer sp. 2205BS26-8]